MLLAHRLFVRPCSAPYAHTHTLFLNLLMCVNSRAFVSKRDDSAGSWGCSSIGELVCAPRRVFCRHLLFYYITCCVRKSVTTSTENLLYYIHVWILYSLIADMCVCLSIHMTTSYVGRMKKMIGRRRRSRRGTSFSSSSSSRLIKPRTRFLYSRADWKAYRMSPL